jgi:hypothetical protein
MIYMKTLRQFLYEKRSNEPLNPKIPAYDYIKKHVEESRVPTYVSLTSLEKLGINPRSTHRDTPIGVYFYESAYVIKTVSERSKNLDELPYVGNQPFVNVFTIKPSANVILVGGDDRYLKKYGTFPSVNKSSLEEYKKMLEEMYRDILDLDELDFIFGYGERIYRDPGKKLWVIVQMISEKISEIRGNENNFILWNKILRELGIDAVVDRGSSIIHMSEPAQGVVLDTTMIDRVWRYPNRGHSRR